MKKSLIFIIIGICLLALGIILSFNKIIFSQDASSNFNDSSEFIYNDSFDSASIKSAKGSIVKFPILKDLEKGNILDNEKNFFSDKYLIKISSYFESGEFTENDMIEAYKIGYQMNYNFEFELKIDDFGNVKHASFSGIVQDLNNNISTYTEDHYFIIQSSPNEFAVVLYSIDDKEFSYSFIKRIANEIEIE